MNKFTFLKVYNSPFKLFLPKLYIGRMTIGVPYFYSRKKVGFDFVGLGYKTKWSDTDYRFEYNPMWSFVFYKWQIALIFAPIECNYYWQAWLYYYYNTKGTKEERIRECKKEYPLKITVSGTKDEERYEYSYDAYDRILK